MPAMANRLDQLAARAAACRDCPLWKDATQTVFGEGPRGAGVMLIGEQPGDREDREGHPFVGPAGGMLDKALREAGLVRERVYITNVVKHFKHVVRGARRIHQSPRVTEIEACSQWLTSELELVQPAAIVCLGATPAKALIRKRFRITRERGAWSRFSENTEITATWHPAYVLRQRDAESRRQRYQELVDDLAAAAAKAGEIPACGI